MLSGTSGLYSLEASNLSVLGLKKPIVFSNLPGILWGAKSPPPHTHTPLRIVGPEEEILARPGVTYNLQVYKNEVLLMNSWSHFLLKLEQWKNGLKSSRKMLG